LWLLYSAFGMVSRAISPLVTPILNDLSISYSQMGLILGSWQLTYICVALVAGAIIDRWGVRKSIFVGAAIIGFSAVLRYFATGFLTLIVFVALFGVGGPMISIGGPKAISQWFNDRNRATAIGIYTAGNWIGGLLALALTNSLIMPYLESSWRATFVCYGLLTFLFCAFWGLMARESRVAPSVGSIGIFEVFQILIGIRNVQILLLMALFSFAIGHGFATWLPKILENSGISPSHAGFAAAVPIASGVPAILLIPRLIPPHFRGRFIAAGALITATGLVIVVNTAGYLLIIGLVIIGFISSPFMPMMLLILMDSPEVGSRYMGAAGGMFFCVAEIGGFTGPLAMGVLVDVTGSFLVGTLFLATLCVAIAVLTVFLKPLFTREPKFRP